MIGLRDKFDVAFACDTDHDRHGIVTRSAGLLPPNHYLAVCMDYLLRNRSGWRPDAGIGKTVVEQQHHRPHRRQTAADGCTKCPWASNGSWTGCSTARSDSWAKSAGAAFLRKDGGVWTTDKDGLIPGLLSAEIIARTGRDPGEAYRGLCKRTR